MFVMEQIRLPVTLLGLRRALNKCGAPQAGSWSGAKHTQPVDTKEELEAMGGAYPSINTHN